MSKVYILVGVSGAGKTSWARELAYDKPGTVVVSADDFFYAGSEYHFEPMWLPDAHAACLRRFVEAVRADGVAEPDQCIVVDNTNTTVAEIAPYAALALAYGYSLEIVIFTCSNPRMAYARNHHGVPLDGVIAQHERLRTLRASLPPWWPVLEV